MKKSLLKISSLGSLLFLLACGAENQKIEQTMSTSPSSQTELVSAQARALQLKHEFNLAIDEAALSRLIQYEEQKLSSDEIAEQETLLTIETIEEVIKEEIRRQQETGRSDFEIFSHVMNNVERDLKNIDEELRHPIKETAYSYLLSNLDLDESIASLGEMPTQEEISDRLMDKMNSLNQKKMNGLKAMLASGQQTSLKAKASALALSDIAEQPKTLLNFNSNKEMALHMLNENSSDAYPLTTRSSISTQEKFSTAETLSLQVSIEFMGVKLNAGPVIEFEQSYSTSAQIIAEGVTPFISNRGEFDFTDRTVLGEPTGNDKQRLIVFACSMNAHILSKYEGKGGFTVGGLGGGAKIEKEFRKSVNISSRNILVPHTIAGKQATLNTLSEFCHNDFANTKTYSRKSLKENLYTLLENTASGLTFTNPDTQCITDKQCYGWYNKLVWLHRVKTAPRCIRSTGNDVLYVCKLRGSQGAHCPVYKDGKRVSSGDFEYVCDKGLKCTITAEGGWFTRGEMYAYWEAKCL